MNVIAAGDLGRVFRRNAELAHRRDRLHHETAERGRRERKQEAEGDAAEFADFAMAMIATSEISDFRLELDNYDAATVAALQANELELNAVREHLDRLLAKAHVLPDGRRVFKTQDGLQVFDEHGAELTASEISPDDIDDRRPRWEEYKPKLEQLNDLIEERSELLEYQSRLDDAREQLDSGELDREAFDDLRQSLRDDMPESARAHANLEDPETSLTQDAENGQAYDLDLSEDRTPTQPGNRLPTPGLDG